jgi:hypothetical protein
VLGDQWQSAPGAPDIQKLQERQVEEDKRRDGAVVSDDLLDYTETYHLTDLIEKNWESSSRSSTTSAGPRHIVA